MRWLPLLLLLGCPSMDGDDPVDTDVVDESDVDSDAPAALEVTIVPEAPRSRADALVCRSEAGATLSWSVDGEPWDGPTATTELPGDTLPAAHVLPRRRYTCLAEAGDAMGLAERTVAPPSVLLILVDDLGYGDVGAYGGEDIPTPRLDALAGEGVRFASGYVSAPTCSPSRAGLITGRQQQRFGFEYNIGRQPVALGQDRGLPRTERTLPNLLGDAGLRSLLVGKWHLGLQPWMWPQSRGFDGFYGFLGGLRLNMAPGLPGVVEAWSPEGLGPWDWPWQQESEVVLEGTRSQTLDPEEHLLDVFVAEAKERLERVGDDPFFLMWSLHTPHEPLQATPEMVALLPEPLPEDPGVLAYRATVAAMDRGIGEVLDHLEALGRADDTLVVFLSDNGCTDSFGWCSNAPLFGGKIRLSEGGLRVPFLARWPDRVPAGEVVEAPIWSLDLLPTLTAAVGIRPPTDREYDGVDLLPLLLDEQPLDREALYWRTTPARAVRAGDLKLVEVGEDAWLFDLAADPGETTDLSGDRPADVARLRALLEAREAIYMAPAWEPQVATLPYFDGADREIPF